MWHSAIYFRRNYHYYFVFCFPSSISRIAFCSDSRKISCEESNRFVKTEHILSLRSRPFHCQGRIWLPQRKSLLTLHSQIKPPGRCELPMNAFSWSCCCWVESMSVIFKRGVWQLQGSGRRVWSLDAKKRNVEAEETKRESKSRCTKILKRCG